MRIIQQTTTSGQPWSAGLGVSPLAALSRCIAAGCSPVGGVKEKPIPIRRSLVVHYDVTVITTTTRSDPNPVLVIGPL